jgi:hypothetical protein
MLYSKQKYDQESIYFRISLWILLTVTLFLGQAGNRSQHTVTLTGGRVIYAF